MESRVETFLVGVVGGFLLGLIVMFILFMTGVVVL